MFHRPPQRLLWRFASAAIAAVAAIRSSGCCALCDASPQRLLRLLSLWRFAAAAVAAVAAVAAFCSSGCCCCCGVSSQRLLRLLSLRRFAAAAVAAVAVRLLRLLRRSTAAAAAFRPGRLLRRKAGEPGVVLVAGERHFSRARHPRRALEARASVL